MTTQGVLLVNLGSPDSTDTFDVYKYLREFLNDPRVIDLSLIKRKVLVEGIIAPFRASNSAEAYKKVWTDQGSPLLVYTYAVQEQLQERLDLPVEVGMRYGNPTTASGIRALKSRGVDEIFLIPMYPHYAMSSYETGVAHVKDCLDDIAPDTRLVVQPPFYDDDGYLDAVAELGKPHLEDDYDHVIFSYHGVPVRQVKATDPSGCYCMQSEDCCKQKHPAHAFCYRHQCYASTWALADRLDIPEDKYTVTFQSRLGSDPWLEPFTDKTLERLPSQNKKRIVVFSPAFVADCLETIEELGMEGREEFLEAGGKEFRLVPCLNDSPAWIDVLESFVDDYQDGALTYDHPAPNPHVG